MTQPPDQSTSAEAAAMTGDGPSATDDVSTQIKLQILSTEHWSLLASRTLAWNESFTRTSMFLSTLSFAIVALALVGQATTFGEEFRIFALVVLPVVLFVGITTSLRLDNSNYHDLICIAGMNRIRANYLHLAPSMKDVFVMGATDDARGIELTAANVPGHGWLADVLAATPALVAVLNATLAGAIGGLLLLQIGIDAVPALAIAAGVFVVAFAIQAYQWRRAFNELVRTYRPVYSDQ